MGARPEDIRKRAEQIVGNEQPADDDKTQRLIYELRVHQVELEMQNEELKTREAELSESRRRYENLFEHAPVGYFVLDQNAVILDANRSAATLLAADEQSLEQKPFIVFVSEESHEQFYSHIRRVFAGGGVQSVEICLTPRSGTARWVRMESRLQNADGGEQRRCFSALVDVTDRKRVEDDLLLAKEEAEGANKAKDVFLANMSHEIRTPMNGILSLAELAQTTEDADQLALYLGGISSSAKALLAIVNDILDFSKIESGHVTVERAPFSIRGLVADVDALFRPMATEKGLSFETAVDVATEHYQGDAARIRQVLVNLVGNALKFTPEGSVTLKAIVTPLNKHMDELRFVVEDTGIGISEAEQREIFGSFTQADSSYSKRFQGTGLGLTISRRIAKLMGGQVFVESTVGRGSTFYFTLPLHKDSNGDQTDQTDQTKRIDGESATTEEKNKTMRILVAEDNPINLLFLSTVLEGEGHTIDQVGNGQDVVNAAQENDYDLIMMDISMPVLNGIDAAKAIRAGKAGKTDVPIIAVSAHAMKGDREAFLQAGMDGYLSKPFTKPAVLAAVAKFAGGRRHEQSDGEQMGAGS